MKNRYNLPKGFKLWHGGRCPECGKFVKEKAPPMDCEEGVCAVRHSECVEKYQRSKQEVFQDERKRGII